MNTIRINQNMKIKYLGPISIAYETYQYESISGVEEIFNRIVHWASDFSHTGSIIRVYEEHFIEKSRDELKMDVGIQIFEPIDIEGDVKLKDLIPNHCIYHCFEFPITDFSKNWNIMFKWMNDNNFKPSLMPPFEIILNNYHEHPENLCIAEFYIPIEEPNYDF